MYILSVALNAVFAWLGWSVLSKAGVGPDGTLVFVSFYAFLIAAHSKLHDVFRGIERANQHSRYPRTDTEGLSGYLHHSRRTFRVSVVAAVWGLFVTAMGSLTGIAPEALVILGAFTFLSWVWYGFVFQLSYRIA